jgi:hypothetical protein
METNVKTAKKEEIRRDDPSYPSQLQRYDVLVNILRRTIWSMS